MANMLRITLTKSMSGRGRRQIDTVRSLGLGRLHETAVHPDTPQVRGMIRKIRHLVSVKAVSGGS